MLQLEVAIVADVAFGLPGVVGAAGRAVADVDHILHRRADHVLRAAIGAATLGDRAGNRVQVAERKRFGQVVFRPFHHGMFLSLRNTLAAIEFMIWHVGILSVCNYLLSDGRLALFVRPYPDHVVHRADEDPAVAVLLCLVDLQDRLDHQVGILVGHDQ